MTYNFDNINEFFEDLMNGKNAKFNMLRVYGAYERECERIKKEQEIKKVYKNTADYRNVFIVNDDIAIVELHEYGNITGYCAHVNNRKADYVWNTFEEALLAAVSIKIAGNEDATEWMWKLVGGK